MNPYTFQTARKIVAGRGVFEQTADQMLQTINVKRAFIVCQPSVARLGHLERLKKALEEKGIEYGISLDVRPEPTVQDIEHLYRQFSRESYDAIVAVGGGSVMDAAKVLSVMRTNTTEIREMLGIERVRFPGVPTVLIPTTAGTGSEVTPNAIITFQEEGLKIGIISRHLLPALAIIDPLLTVALPKPITAATGMDAFTHALESFLSNKANPVSDMFALEAIRKISGSIVRAFHHGNDPDAREEMLLGAMYGGMALTGAGTAAVHAMAYPIGGKFHVPHGVANAMLLPHVMEFNLDAVTDRLVPVARAMGLDVEGRTAEQAAGMVLDRIRQWTKELEIPQDLKAYGVREEDVHDLAVAASQVTRLMDNNPKPMSVPDIEAIYRKLI